MVKNPPVNAGDAVLSPGDPLEKETATHSNILAWQVPWTEEPGGPDHGVVKSWTQLSD